MEKELIEKGLAKVAYIYGDYEHVDELRKTEEIAKSNKVGIWSDINLADEVITKEDNSNTEEDNNLIKVINFIFDILKKIFALLFE